MTTNEAQRFVLGATVVTIMVVGLARVLDKRQLPRARSMIGAVVVAVVLSFLAEASPRLASWLAALIVTGALMTSGVEAFGVVAPSLRKTVQ